LIFLILKDPYTRFLINPNSLINPSLEHIGIPTLWYYFVAKKGCLFCIMATINRSGYLNTKAPIGIIVGVLLAYRAIAQPSSVKTIIDSQTGRPVSYAAVFYPSIQKGEITDDLGTFRVGSSNAKPGDSVRISALGYHTTIFEIRFIHEHDTLFLSPEPIQLGPVTITAKGTKTSTKTLGFVRKLGVVVNGYGPNSNIITATFVAAEGLGLSPIRKVVCSIVPKENELVSTFRVRVRLLTPRSDIGLPHKDLLVENVVVDIPVNAHMLEFDLTAQSLLLPPTGVWVAVESLGYTDTSGVYRPINDDEFGKFIMKNSRKKKVKSITRIAPMYQYVRSGEKISAFKSWNSSWSYFTFDPKMTLCFGLKVEVSK
jgi:hypothetical protein